MNNWDEFGQISVGIYLFKVNNGDIRTICAVCSKITIKTPEWCQWGVFTVNFEQISQIAAMLIITLDITQSEALLGTSETFKTELFAKIING